MYKSNLIKRRRYIIQDFIPLITDINGQIKPIDIKQYDNKSRKLYIQLMDIDNPQEQKVNLENHTVRAYFRLPDDSDALIDGEIIDAADGIFTIILPSGITSITGEVICEILIYGNEDNTFISLNPFTITIKPSFYTDNAILADDKYSSLDRAFFTIDELSLRVNSLAAMADSGEINAGSVESEVIDARCSYDSLHDAVAAALNSGASEAQLAQIEQNKEDIDKLKELSAGSIHEYFYADGCGRNKCDPTRNVAGRLNSDGTIDDSISGIYTSDFIELPEGETHIIAATPTSGISYNRIAFFQADKKSICGFSYSGTTAVEIPAEAKYVRVSNYYASQVKAFFVGFGESYEGWEDFNYGTIHPNRLPSDISEESIKLQIDNAVALQFPIEPENTAFFTFEKSSNLLSTQDCEIGRLTSSGDIDTNAASYKTTAFVDIHGNAGKKLIPQYNKTTLGCNAYAFYRQNKEFLSGYSYSSKSAIAIPDGAYFFRMSVDYRSKDLLVGISNDTAAIPYENYYSKKLIDKRYINIELPNWYKGKKGVAIGDSITNNGKTYITEDGREGSSWRELVAAELELADTIYNCGIGGSRVSSSDPNSNAMWTDGRINAIPNDVNFILFNGGMNDWMSNAALGNEDDTDTSTFYGALNIIAQKLMQRFPAIPIFFMTTTYGYKPNLADGKNAINLTLYDYGRAIKATAERYGFPCIDLYALCGMNRHNYTHFLNDESSSEFSGYIHPNRNGGKRIAAAICSELKGYQPID